MRLFFKEHQLFIVLQMMQFGLFFFILWLDGYRNLLTLGYAIFLSIFLLGCYLVYRYVTRRAFYTRLSQPMVRLDESLERTSQDTIAENLERLLRSQYKLYKEELSETEMRQEEHLRFIDRWVHQMKTPLSVIELTAQDLDEPKSSNIREETDRMKTGLRTVLYMARLRTIEQDFRITPVDLEQLIQTVNKENRRFFIRYQVYPKLKTEKLGMTVESDEKWLLFMIEQIIQNAVKYSTGKSQQVNLTLYEREGEAIFEVQDFGVGIPVEDRNRIFHPFYTGENGRNYRESTGMGLYLAKEVADYLGHDLEMESEVRKGTTFRIVFSRAQNLTTM